MNVSSIISWLAVCCYLCVGLCFTAPKSLPFAVLHVRYVKAWNLFGDFVIRPWFSSKILAVKREVMFTWAACLTMHVSLCVG